jgi:glutamate racemase
VLQIVMGERVTLVSSAEETAKDVVRVLTERDLLAEPGSPAHELIATGPAEPFARLARRFLGPVLGFVAPLVRS